jgi:hypothetical protein
MSAEEKIMDSEEAKKIRDALDLVTQAIHAFAERSPDEKTGAPPMKLGKTCDLLDKARAKLGLRALGRHT